MGYPEESIMRGSTVIAIGDIVIYCNVNNVIFAVITWCNYAPFPSLPFNLRFYKYYGEQNKTFKYIRYYLFTKVQKYCLKELRCIELQSFNFLHNCFIV